MNRFHLSYASPAIVAGLACAAVRLLADWRRVRALALVLVIVWTIPGAILTLAGARRSARSTTRVWSSVPHLEGVRIDRGEEARLRADIERIRSAPAMFLIGPRATLHRLVAGIANPTPFDEFSRMGFGTRGQEEVIARIRSGELRPVCLERETVSPSPAALLDFVQSSLTPAEDLGVCRLYR